MCKVPRYLPVLFFLFLALCGCTGESSQKSDIEKDSMDARSLEALKNPPPGMPGAPAANKEAPPGVPAGASVPGNNASGK